MKPKKNNGWWNIDDKKPKDQQECLVVTKNGCMVEAKYDMNWINDDGDFDHYDVWGIPHPVTHWRPRPKFPVTE